MLFFRLEKACKLFLPQKYDQLSVGVSGGVCTFGVRAPVSFAMSTAHNSFKYTKPHAILAHSSTAPVSARFAFFTYIILYV